MSSGKLPLDGQLGALGAVAAGLEGDPAHLDTATGGSLGPGPAAEHSDVKIDVVTRCIPC